MEEISRQDLTENVVMIRINKAYHCTTEAFYNIS